MSSLQRGFKALRNSAGALSLGFLAAACGSAPVQETAPAAPMRTSMPVTAQKLAATQSEISGVTATTMSQMQNDIARQANEHVRTSNTTPKHRIVFLDLDELNTFAGLGATSPSQKFFYYMRERGITLESNDGMDTFRAIGGSYGPNSANPQALSFTAHDGDNRMINVCIVVPENPNLSSRSVMEKWIGKAGPRYLQASVDPGAYMMALRVAWHEAWHCLDDEFVHAYEQIDSDKGFEHALGIHKAEMFADIAATLTMASQGQLDILKYTADSRAVHSRWNGPKMMEDYHAEYDSEYYSGITYFNSFAHDALERHIKEVGMERIQRYTMADIQRVATSITHEHALTAGQFRAVADYLKNGTIAGDQADFMNSYIERTSAAKARLLTETNRTVPPFVDVVPPTMDEILQATTAAEKRDIMTALELAAQNAVRNGMTARQGIYGQLEEWRKQVHTSPKREERLERKLYLAGLLLISGYMDTTIVPDLPLRAPHP